LRHEMILQSLYDGRDIHVGGIGPLFRHNFTPIVSPGYSKN
jgi:hypothetical protein